MTKPRRDAVALVAYLEAREGWTFGHAKAARTQDCARWAAGAVEAQTGRNPLRRFAGRWGTTAGARRVIRRHGGMAAAVTEVLTPVAVTAAKRGDIGLVGEDFDGQLVVVEGDMVVGLAPGGGYRRLPRSALSRAWSAD